MNVTFILGEVIKEERGGGGGGGGGGGERGRELSRKTILVSYSPPLDGRLSVPHTVVFLLFYLFILACFILIITFTLLQHTDANAGTHARARTIHVTNLLTTPRPFPTTTMSQPNTNLLLRPPCHDQFTFVVVCITPP